MPVRRKIYVPFDIPLPMVLDDTFSLLKYSSFSRGCRFYKDRWQPIVNDDFLNCKEENGDEYDSCDNLR